jgi:hypothetical protein
MNTMPQNPAASAFLKRIAQNDDLDGVLAPSLIDEAELRGLFATHKNHHRLSDPFVGLVDVFAAPDNIRKTKARVVKDDDDLVAKYVMPLSQEQRRKDGDPSMVASLEEFKKSFQIFTGKRDLASSEREDG